MHINSLEYRKEIDGLRALAVLPVILFHAGVEQFSGGFVGVDIFFVISGYLITSIIFSEIANDSFSIVNFYERRARRILPALFVVLFSCLPFAWFWMLPSDYKDFSTSLIYVSTFSSNILFAGQMGYFDAASELKPLLHTWSLAIEEQYYVFFPVFLLIIWRIRRNWLVGLVLLTALTSFFFSQWISTQKIPGGFYFFSTRIWELLIGALVALYLRTNKCCDNKNLSSVFSSFGIIIIIYAIFNFDESTPYPGLYTLIPTLGTALVVVFADKTTLAGRFLANPLLVAIGLISYSAYLWHQPILAFVRHNNNISQTPYLLFIQLISIFVFSYITWRFVENPFRDKRKFNRNKIFMFSFLGIYVFAMTGFIGVFNNGFYGRSSIPFEVSSAFSPPSICEGKLEKNMSQANFCHIGYLKDVHPEIAVFGDSQANAILPAFDIIGSRLKKGVVGIWLGGCVPFINIYTLHGNYEKGVCEDVAQQQLSYVKNNNIKKIFLVGRWPLYTDGNYEGKGVYYLGLTKSDSEQKQISRAAFEKGLSETVRAYNDIGVKVYIVTQAPLQLVTDIKQFYYSMYSDALSYAKKSEQVQSLAVPTQKHNALKRYSRSLFAKYADKGEIQLIDLDPVFCNDAVCAFGTKNQSYYQDESHLSYTGANLTIPTLIEYVN